MMTDSLSHRLAWLAGIIDGEGSITASVARSCYVRKDGSQGQALAVTVNVTNTDESLLGEVGRIADELGVKYNLNLITRNRPNNKPCWQLVFMGFGRVEKILSAVLPYLVAKRGRAELMLRIIRHRRATVDARPGLSPRTRVASDAWLMSALGDLKFLNHRGPVPVPERL